MSADSVSPGRRERACSGAKVESARETHVNPECRCTVGGVGDGHIPGAARNRRLRDGEHAPVLRTVAFVGKSVQIDPYVLAQVDGTDRCCAHEQLGLQLPVHRHDVKKDIAWTDRIPWLRANRTDASVSGRQQPPGLFGADLRLFHRERVKLVRSRRLRGVAFVAEAAHPLGMRSPAWSGR